MMTGEQLKTMRIKLGWTIEEISEISFMSKNTIIRLEKGEITKPSTLNYLNYVYRDLRKKPSADDDKLEENGEENTGDWEDWYALF